jgi:hypothetical protein
VFILTTELSTIRNYHRAYCARFLQTISTTSQVCSRIHLIMQCGDRAFNVMSDPARPVRSEAIYFSAPTQEPSPMPPESPGSAPQHPTWLSPLGGCLDSTTQLQKPVGAIPLQSSRRPASIQSIKHQPITATLQSTSLHTPSPTNPVLIANIIAFRPASPNLLPLRRISISRSRSCLRPL